MCGGCRADRKADTLLGVPPTQLSMSQQEIEHILALLMTHMGVMLMQCDKSPLLSFLLFLPGQYQFNVNCHADCGTEHSEVRSCQNHCLCILLCIHQRPFPIWCRRQGVHSQSSPVQHLPVLAVQYAAQGLSAKATLLLTFPTY